MNERMPIMVPPCEPLADLAETIEMMARAAVEAHEPPLAALEHVSKLRKLFESTLELLERDSNPLIARKGFGGFGRRTAA